MYCMEVEAEKIQGLSDAGNEVDNKVNKLALNLPTPLSVAHNAQKLDPYIFLVLSFFIHDSTMLQLTEMTLFHWDLAQEFLSDRLYNEKKDFSGPHAVNRVQKWVAKVQSPRQSLQAIGSSASTHSYLTAIVNTKFTTSSGCQVRPMGSSNDGLGHCRSESEPNDGEYHDTLVNLPKCSQQVPSMVCDSSHSVWCTTFTLRASTRTSSK